MKYYLHMFNSINKLVNNKNCYEYLVKYSPILLNNSNNLHNSHRLSFHKPSMKTFEGYYACGAISYLLYHYIKKYHQPVEIKFLLSRFGYGKYLEDHLYLQVDKYIVDPTYKQFLVSYDPTNKYLDFVFNECPFIYVGTDIEGLYRKCQDKYLDVTSHKLNDDNLIFWQNSKDVTKLYLNKDINKIAFNSKEKEKFLKFIDIF